MRFLPDCSMWRRHRAPVATSGSLQLHPPLGVERGLLRRRNEQEENEHDENEEGRRKAHTLATVLL